MRTLLSSLTAIGLTACLFMFLDVIEDEPGHYDFTSVDHVIRSARKNGLKVVMIWFAS